MTPSGRKRVGDTPPASVNPFVRRMLEAQGVIKKPRATRRKPPPVGTRGVTRPALDAEVGKRRVQARRAKASRRRNR